MVYVIAFVNNLGCLLESLMMFLVAEFRGPRLVKSVLTGWRGVEPHMGFLLSRLNRRCYIITNQPSWVAKWTDLSDVAESLVMFPPTFARAMRCN